MLQNKAGYSCCSWNIFQSLERLHCTAARVIFNLPKTINPVPGKAMSSAEVLEMAQWTTPFFHYKSATGTFICVHKAYHDRSPNILSDDNIIKKAGLKFFFLLGKTTF